MSTDSPSNRLTMSNPCYLINLPKEVQVHLLTYLRAHCLANLQLTCKWFHSVDLVHSIVSHTAEFVYPPHMTAGFEKQPVGTTTTTSNEYPFHSKGDNTTPFYYTFEYLRNMELLVIARILSSPEPKVGYVVSKSWCKTALKWLDEQQEAKAFSNRNRVKGRKGKRDAKKLQSSRRTSEAVKPCPNVNSDITCHHQQLQHLESNKSARARRRLLDRQAWRILKALYPESTTIESVFGECIQCCAEAEMKRKSVSDQKEQEKTLRKLPLADSELRRIYTRTRGVPEQSLRTPNAVTNKYTLGNQLDACLQPLGLNEVMKQPSSTKHSTSEASLDLGRFTNFCPLVEGTYFILPRSWCHGWRRYMKTGEGGHTGQMSNHKSTTFSQRNVISYPPPDAACLLCDAHRLILLPPHLEAYLFDTYTTGDMSQDQRQLFKSTACSLDRAFATAAQTDNESVTDPFEESIRALREAGLTEAELTLQFSAMRSVEQRHQQQRILTQTEGIATDNNDGGAQHSSRETNSELLDRENHTVVEILTEDEYRALKQCWQGNTLFGLRFHVSDITTVTSAVTFNAQVCRDCDASGRGHGFVIKNRARGWLRKSNEKARAPASLEY